MANVALTFHTTTFDVIDRNGQPWIRANQIGLALEYKNPELSIAKLYRANAEEFSGQMTDVVKLTTAGGPQDARIFSLRGAHLLAMFARTKIAKAFRRWVLDILDAYIAESQQSPAQRPYNPAIDYTRISPAQAQDIKELVHQVVDSGVQGFPDTWARLHKKFRVNSYLELPATKYDEVCAYLRGKLPNGYTNNVVLDADASMLGLQRIHAAMQAATEAGAQVQQAVFESVLAGNDEWKFGRWLLSFITDSKLAAPAIIQRVGHDEFVTSTRQLIDCINDPGFLLSNTELAGLAQACTNRLARRFAGGTGPSAA